MGNVSVEVTVTGVHPDAAFASLSDFSRYPKLTDVVRNVTVSEVDGHSISQWEVNFRKGVMKWTERDVFDWDNREIVFEQTEGDPASFAGRWRVLAGDDDTIRISFEADFDLGMPSIASIVEPIAERTLVENTRLIIEQLMDGQVPA